MQNLVLAFDGTMDVFKSFVRTGLESVGSFLSVFSNFNIGAAVIICVFIIILAFSLLRNGVDFTNKIKRTRVLAICAMLIATNVILGYFSLNLTSYLRIGFGFITTPVAATLFGPIVGGIVALLSDIVSYILKPTGGFLFTYTLNTGIAGIIYGTMLYNKKPTFLRVFVTKLIVIVFVNIILNSIALAPTVGSGLIGIMPARIVKNFLLLPIQTIIVYIVLKATVHRVK